MIKILNYFLSLAIILASLSSLDARPYGFYNRPGAEYSVTETKYFRVIATDKTPNTKNHILAIADSTYENLNRFYNYKPDEKIAVIIVDFEDLANGFAEYGRNRITIFPTPADFTSRDRRPWLNNVFTHELSHIISLNVASSFHRKTPWLILSSIARVDSINQASVRVPIFGANYSHWFAEGIAQYDTEKLNRDSFDKNRQAYQYAMWEDSMLYDLKRLAFFGGRKWYNTGFSLFHYLDSRFGPGSAHKLVRQHGESFYYNHLSVFKDTFGLSAKEIEKDFRKWIGENFEKHLKNVEDGIFDGKEVKLESNSLDYNTLSVKEKEFLRKKYRASKSRFYGEQILFMNSGMLKSGKFDPKKKSITEIKTITDTSDFAKRDSNSYFVLKRRSEKHRDFWQFYRAPRETSSLYLAFEDGSEKMLFKDISFEEIDYCQNKKILAAIHNDGDGGLNLAFLDLKDHADNTKKDLSTDKVLSFPLGKKILAETRHPRFNKDCSKLYYTKRIGEDYDIFVYDLNSNEETEFYSSSDFDLYPEPTEKGVFFVSPSQGDMRIYLKEYEKDEIRIISKAVTGHHYPSYSEKLKSLVFSRFYGIGLRLHAMKESEFSQETIRLPAKIKKVLEVVTPKGFNSSSYSIFNPSNYSSPSLTPILNYSLSSSQESGDRNVFQFGAESYVEDQLGQNSLFLRILTGNTNTFLLRYDNRVSYFDIYGGALLWTGRYNYEYGANGKYREWVNQYQSLRFFSGIGLPINALFSIYLDYAGYSSIHRDFGGSKSDYSFSEPAVENHLSGIKFIYTGRDRSNPSFSDRGINKRGFSEFRLGVSHGYGKIDPRMNRRQNPIDYTQFTMDWTKHFSLPKLRNGFFDHSLQVDLNLGYIDRNVDSIYEEFQGGGYLYSPYIPDQNTSVGFAGYRGYSISGETLASFGLSYRFPLARKMNLSLGQFFIEDIYLQLFSSLGNIWGFKPNGERQIPFKDNAENGNKVLTDLGLDLRIANYFQELDSDFGTTLRVVYRLNALKYCSDRDSANFNGTETKCSESRYFTDRQDSKQKFSFYLMFGGGF